MNDRDRSIDVLRAVAIAGVVGGHWLVTGLVIGADGGWRQSSPLSAMPALAPVSWLFQTLGLFFFAGGFSSALPRRRAPRRKATAARLGVPLLALLGFWALVLVVATAAGVPFSTRRTIAVLVISPLWFLLPYLALRAATGPLARAVDRVGPWPLIAPAVALVLLSDLHLLPGWTAIAAAWSVPWVLGIVVARRGRAALPARTLLIAGATGMAALIVVFGYPASAVGVPGDGRSNLSPPSLFAVALAAAQIGIYLLVTVLVERRSRLFPAAAGPTSGAIAAGIGVAGPSGVFGAANRQSRTKATPAPPPPPPLHWVGGTLGRRYDISAKRLWTGGVRSLNRAALPIYLGHQSVLVGLTGITAAVAPGAVPGLLSAPAGPPWIMARLAWLPFLALVLAGLVRVAWPATRTAQGDLNRA